MLACPDLWIWLSLGFGILGVTGNCTVWLYCILENYHKPMILKLGGHDFSVYVKSTASFKRWGEKAVIQSQNWTPSGEWGAILLLLRGPSRVWAEGYGELCKVPCRAFWGLKQVKVPDMLTGQLCSRHVKGQLWFSHGWNFHYFLALGIPVCTLQGFPGLSVSPRPGQDLW